MPNRALDLATSVEAPGRTHSGVCTPIVLQAGWTDCAAASLAILLAYHGKSVSLGELRSACRVRWWRGSTGADIVSTARNYGMDAGALRCPDRFLPCLRLPIIAHLARGHFLVVESVDATHVYVNDPLSGRSAIDRQVFASQASGVVISCVPGPDSGFLSPVPARRKARLGWPRLPERIRRFLSSRFRSEIIRPQQEVTHDRGAGRSDALRDPAAPLTEIPEPTPVPW